MKKKVVEFLKAHGRYVRGDIAGFEPAVVAKWPEGICVPYDPGKPRVTEVEAARLVADAQHLNDRLANLDGREAALAAREAALEEREKAAGAETDPAPAEQEKTTEEPKGNGEPPKQGAKKQGA